MTRPYSKFVYAPRPGDEVIWPNGLRMTFNTELSADGVIVTTGVPEDDTLVIGSYEGHTWLIGVTQ